MQPVGRPGYGWPQAVLPCPYPGLPLPVFCLDRWVARRLVSPGPSRPSPYNRTGVVACHEVGWADTRVSYLLGPWAVYLVVFGSTCCTVVRVLLRLLVTLGRASWYSWYPVILGATVRTFYSTRRTPPRRYLRTANPSTAADRSSQAPLPNRSLP